MRLNFCRSEVCRIQPSIIKADTFTNLRNWLSFQKIEEYLFIIPKYCPMTGSTNLHGDSQEISHQKKFDSHFIKSARQQLPSTPFTLFASNFAKGKENFTYRQMLMLEDIVLKNCHDNFKMTYLRHLKLHN